MTTFPYLGACKNGSNIGCHTKLNARENRVITTIMTTITTETTPTTTETTPTTTKTTITITTTMRVKMEG